jgi:hypothetical protein
MALERGNPVGWLWQIVAVLQAQLADGSAPQSQAVQAALG